MKHLFDYAKNESEKCTAGIGNILSRIIYRGDKEVICNEEEFVCWANYIRGIGSDSFLEYNVKIVKEKDK